MYKERGIGSKSEIRLIDRERINDALDKHMERSSPSTSRGLNNGKDRNRVPHPDQQPGSMSKNKCSDGEIS